MITDEFVGETKANIRTLFKQDEEMKKDITRIEDQTDKLKEITTILKLQQLQYADHTQTLLAINDNLVNLNSTVRTLQDDMDNVKNQVVNIQESGKFDMRKFKKEFLYKVLPTVLGTLIAAWIIYHYGWK